MIRKVDHLGIAVKCLKEARKFYEEVLGLPCEKIEEIASQQVRAAFYTVGDLHIELLEATTPDSPIAKFIATRGEGFHHIAYACDDLENQLQHAAEAGCQLINQVPVRGAGDKLVAFLHPKSTNGVLTEFCSDALREK